LDWIDQSASYFTICQEMLSLWSISTRIKWGSWLPLDKTIFHLISFPRIIYYDCRILNIITDAEPIHDCNQTKLPILLHISISRNHFICSYPEELTKIFPKLLNSLVIFFFQKDRFLFNIITNLLVLWTFVFIHLVSNTFIYHLNSPFSKNIFIEYFIIDILYFNID